MLSVTWRHESTFRTDPPPNPRYENGTLVGYDVGPLQLSTNYYYKSPFTDGLPKAFTSNHFLSPDPGYRPFTPAVNLNSFSPSVGFNGDVSQNLLAGARAFSRDILPRSNSLADAAGLYRAGSRSGPYQSRYDEYTSEAAADKLYLDCLKGQKN